MARRVTDETLEEIRQRIEIADLIGSRITLKRAGATYKACCPFHKEKTPSFIVNPVRRFYHCFGCGAHGDIFKFLMEIDGLTFMDAVRTLAERALVPLDTEVDYQAAARQRLHTLHGELAAFYQRCLQQLRSAQKARDYLAARQLDAETIKRFNLGYAPPRRRLLQEWASRNNYTLAEMVEAGLLLPPRSERPDDDYYDRFRGRLIFPICDATGRVVGFSGRILDPAASPAKYVNSPETPIFHKGSLLYGLDLARTEIVKHPRREALICEGQIDVIRCHAAGFTTAVAAQGTAFTSEHVQQLKRYADTVVLAYDGDAAGRKAAIRTGALLIAAGIPVRVAALGTDQDPDSLLRDRGADAFRQLIDEATSIIAFQIATLQAAEQNPAALDAINRIAGDVMELLLPCDKAVLRSHLLQEAATLLQLPITALEADLATLQERQQARDRAAAAVAAASSPATPLPRANDQPAAATALPSTAATASRPAPPPASSVAFSLCELLLHHYDDSKMVERITAWLPLELITEPEAREILLALVAPEGGGEEHLSQLAESAAPATRRWIERLIRSDSPLLHTSEVTPCRAAEDIIARLWVDHLKRERATLTSSDEAETTRRFALTHLIKALEQIAPWRHRAALLTPELSHYQPLRDGR